MREPEQISGSAMGLPVNFGEVATTTRPLSTDVEVSHAAVEQFWQYRRNARVEEAKALRLETPVEVVTRCGQHYIRLLAMVERSKRRAKALRQLSKVMRTQGESLRTAWMRKVQLVEQVKTLHTQNVALTLRCGELDPHSQWGHVVEPQASSPSYWIIVGLTWAAFIIGAVVARLLGS
jgi:hypothetical protein